QLSRGPRTARDARAEGMSVLARLPFGMELRPAGGHVPGRSGILVRGTPLRIDSYWFEDQPDSFFEEMAAAAGARAGDVVCCGHTHLPWHREVNGVHVVNTGSVGRPKDGNWRAGYVVLDMGGQAPVVEFPRVEYHIDRVIDEIRRNGLPEEL